MGKNLREKKGGVVVAAGFLAVREALTVGICPMAAADGLALLGFPITPNVK